MTDVAAAMNAPLPGLPPAPAPARRTRRAAPKKVKAKKRAAPKKRKAKAAKRAPVATTRRGRRGAMTLTLGNAVELMNGLHRTDMPVFKAISDALGAQAVPSRKRLMAALNAVFG